MKRNIRNAVLVLLLATPAIAVAAPGKWHDDTRADITERMLDEHGGFTCSAGTSGSLVVAAAALGVMLRRRH